MSCRILVPIVDASRINMIAVETTGPLPNTDVCQCNRKRCRHRRHK